MVRVWREARYYENKSQQTANQTASVNKFLDDYDVKYRLRRVGFLLRKVHQLRSLAIKLRQGKDKYSLSDIERRLLERLDRRQNSLSSMDFEALTAALNCLAGGFGQALQELRATVWMPVPPDPAATQSRAASRDTLDQLLCLLLGDQLQSPLKVLHTRAKEPVEIKMEDLPPPSPLRTLQENVFARAKALFGLAQGASRTEIQDLLEEDLEALRTSYAAVIRSSPGRKVPLVRDLLGDPKLVPSARLRRTAEVSPLLSFVSRTWSAFATERSIARQAGSCANFSPSIICGLTNTTR